MVPYTLITIQLQVAFTKMFHYLSKVLNRQIEWVGVYIERLFAGRTEQFYTEQNMGCFFTTHLNNPPDDQVVIVNKLSIQLPLI